MTTLKNLTGQSEQDLIDELKVLAKNLKTLQAKHEFIVPSIPQDFVEVASLKESITGVKAAQVDIGKELLRRDEIRQQERIEKLEITKQQGIDTADELLKQLPSFSADVAVAFTALGQQYAEILKLSETVRKTNLAMMNANLPVNASLKTEPNHLCQLMKEQFRASFGVKTTNALLSIQAQNFDIVEAVKTIKQEHSNVS